MREIVQRNMARERSLRKEDVCMFCASNFILVVHHLPQIVTLSGLK
jgi:hypothetical protein